MKRYELNLLNNLLHVNANKISKFEIFRLPSLENKLTDVNHILTKAEDDINRVETCNLEDLQLQIDRANNHLATVENLFSAIDSFSAEFNVEVLQEEWVELTHRAARLVSPFIFLK